MCKSLKFYNYLSHSINAFLKLIIFVTEWISGYSYKTFYLGGSICQTYWWTIVLLYIYFKLISLCADKKMIHKL